MTGTAVAVAVIALLIGLAAGVWFVLKQKRQAHLDEFTSGGELEARRGLLAPLRNAMSEKAPASEVQVLDASGGQAVVIAPLTDATRFESAKPLSLPPTLKGRVNAMMQGVPQLMVTEAHRGKRIMEVVIKGDLIRAADGNGYRAMAKAAGGKVKEHARLLDTNKLGAVVNAAAIWQVASVVVAQKHLADIAEKLQELSKAVTEIGEFLTRERRSLVSGTYDYLKQAADILEGGELSASIRTELESCERELMQVQRQLVDEVKSKLSSHVAHTERVGTEEFHKSLVAKYEGLGASTHELQTCLQTRVLAAYVLSLYPGEQGTKRARQQALVNAGADFSQLQRDVQKSLQSELDRFNSKLNLESTLQKRKADIRQAASVAEEKLLQSHQTCTDGISRTEALLLKHDQPTHLFLEMEGSQVCQVRMRDAAFA